MSTTIVSEDLDLDLVLNFSLDKNNSIRLCIILL